MNKIIPILFLAITFSSCGIYTSYHRQNKVDSALYREALRIADTTSIATLSWKELFQDKQLQALIDTALVHNTDLRTAHLRTDAAKAVLQNARLSYLPTVNLTPQGTLTHWDKVTSKSYNLGLYATWEIDIFGKVTNAKHGAKEALEASYSYEQAVQTQMIATVASGYYTLLMLDEQLRISKETLINWQQTVRSLEALKLAGQVNDAGVLQAKANCLSLETSILEMEKTLKECENMLCSTLAQPYKNIPRGSLSEQSFPDSLSIGLPINLLSHRPDVQIAESQLAQAFYTTNAARAAFYPSITLSGSSGWTNAGSGVVINPGELLLNIIGSLTQPLFNQGRNIASLKVAKVEQEAAKLAFQQSLLNAGEEVNNALTAWQTARNCLEIDNKQIRILQEAVHKTELLMLHSSINYLEVLTARQDLLAAEQAKTEHRLNEIQSVIQLYHALGGGKQ
ncbi:MAG: efflux transporter outer membrane subunit [Macellibacteroides fermentans]|uniref:efflux transporter outer membrane subunit n=1 Tax=Macellibacteroides fermentans TaxID=879969 RepID=UPI003ABF9D4F